VNAVLIRESVNFACVDKLRIFRRW